MSHDEGCDDGRCTGCVAATHDRAVEPAPTVSEAGQQVVTSLVAAGKQSFTSPYTVTVKKIEPITGSNQVRVTLFVTGDDEPAHDFTETGQQVVTAFLNAGMRANVSGAGTATVQQIEAIEGGDDDAGDDDADENSDADALSGLVANAAAPESAPDASASTQSPAAGRKVAGAPFDDDRPEQHVRPPRAP